MEIRKAITLRFGVVYFSIALFGLVVIARILIIQNVDTKHWVDAGKDLRNNTTPIWAKRGNICADDGSILSTSIPYYRLRLDMESQRLREIYSKESDKLVDEITGFFGLPREDFKAKMGIAYEKKKNGFLITNELIDRDRLKKFQQLKMMSRAKFGSALVIETENRRILPHGDLASRTIGVLNKGAFGGVHGNVGFTGIEGLAESQLAGVDGLALKTNISGNWTNIPIVDAKEGKDVITTLNVNLQDYAQTALGKQMELSRADWGTAIVMEVKTGNIKAIANMGLKKDSTYGETYNYAFGQLGCCEPGSTFKLVSMIIAMEEGVVDTSDMYDTGHGKWTYCKQDMYDSDKNGHGLVTMKQIFELSSNIGTAKIITKYFEGREKDFIDRVYSFGLNKKLGLGFPGEAEPRIKYPTDKDWSCPSLAWISYGYEIKVSPIQTLTFYNAIANNGVMVKPKFIDEIREDGITVQKNETEVLNPLICSKNTLHKAQDMLRGVCTKGTAKNLKNPYYTIAGKTGTAVIANGNKGYTVGGAKRYQASFCGYFPANNPLYSCIVVIVGPKGQSVYGGSVAGPVFRSIADKVYAAYLDPAKDSIPPYKEVPQVKPGLKEDVVMFSNDLGFNTQVQNLTSDHVAVSADSTTVFVNGVNDTPGIVPDVVGMGANDAVFLLEKDGLKVESKGFGRVYRQSPIAGSPFVKGDVVSLDLGFDELQIVKRDSVASNDTVMAAVVMPTQPEPETDEAPVTIASPVQKKPEVVQKKKAESTPKKTEKTGTATKSANAGKSSNAKAKPSPEAIKRWKAKVAAQKAAHDKQNKSASKSGNAKKTTVQSKKKQK